LLITLNNLAAGLPFCTSYFSTDFSCASVFWFVAFHTTISSFYHNSNRCWQSAIFRRSLALVLFMTMLITAFESVKMHSPQCALYKVHSAINNALHIWPESCVWCCGFKHSPLASQCMARTQCDILCLVKDVFLYVQASRWTMWNVTITNFLIWQSFGK